MSSRFHYKTSVSTESLVGEGLGRFMAVGKMTLGKCECTTVIVYKQVFICVFKGGDDL